MTTPGHGERPLDLGGVPDEENVSAADAAERVGTTPEEQENRVDAPDLPEEGVDP